MHLVERNDLMFSGRGAIARLRAGALMHLLGLNKLNRIYRQMLSDSSPGAERLLKRLRIQYTIGDKDRSNIPAQGPVIFIANHPMGALDGVILFDLISRVRPDVRSMSNFLLKRIDFMKDYFIAVDPFDGADAGRNMRGIRESLTHLQGGGALVIFPAGEVATWQKGFCHVTDKPWSSSVIRFIRKARVPVVPICIEGRNSLGFHLAGKIDPRLRTALLPRELLNKRGKTIKLNIGSALTPKRAAPLENEQVYADYLRANVEYMAGNLPRRKVRIIPRRKPASVEPDDITPAREREKIKIELEAIRSRYLLFESGIYDVYFAPSSEIPNMMHEIGRMREVTFREVGEGSLKSIDTDHYDEYYNQLFIWDRENESLLGAYRMGMGKDIVNRYGLDGFYVNSLFKMAPQMAPIMEQSIELGRSFITTPYQRKAVSLMLLWKGILYVLLKHEEYNNLMGPVTISGEFQSSSKLLIADFLTRCHFDNKLAPYISPVLGMKGIHSRIDLSLTHGVEELDLINKLVCDIERDEFSIPILIRKYMQVNSHVLGFNVDPDFNNCLDALILLDLRRIPESLVAMLSKEITEIDVMERFRRAAATT